jgi:hypothetical protein
LFFDMKKFGFLFISVLFCGALAAQTPAKTTPAAKPAPAKPAQAATTNAPAAQTDPGYKFDKLDHDYGTIAKGAEPYCEFRLTNTGKTPLVIASAVGSCGCTVPEYPKEPIAPGQTVIIKVRYDTQRIGHFEKQVTVTFAGIAQPTYLKIHGTVEAPPAEQPFPAPGNGTGNTGAPVNN